MVHIKASALAALAAFVTSSTAHSWVEQLMAIDSQGQFTGSPGYARNNTLRTTPGFSDLLMVHILPKDGQPTIEERDNAPTISAVDTMGITPTDPMCKRTQQQQSQSSGSPRLSAPAGSMVALRYQENGHVTLPKNQPGKPANRGTVYIYGTTQPKDNENFLDIFNKWTADGSGGDKRGKLIATQPYDDGQCYQMNTGSISQQRQQQFPHAASQLMGADLWCQNDIKLPTDAVSGKPYTLYWVWDWPTEPGADPNVPKGKAEIYTTCMDIDVTAPAKKARNVKEARAVQAQATNSAFNNAAIPSYMSSLAGSGAPATQAAASAPATSSPAAPSSTQAASAPASAPAASAPPASAPAAAAPAASTMDASEAAAIVTAAIASLEAAVLPQATGAAKPATVTVTQPAQPTTVYMTAAASASPVINGAQQEASMAAAAPQSPQASSAAPAASSAAQPSSVASIPPSSMDIQPPATGAAAAPPASTASAAPASTSLTLSSPFSGTATPVGNATASATPSVAARDCAKCKVAKRSRILGPAQ